MIITTGMFTEAARNFAQSKHLDLIKGPQLAAMIDSVMVGGVQRDETVDTQAPTPSESLCPSCGGSDGAENCQEGQQRWPQVLGMFQLS